MHSGETLEARVTARDETKTMHEELRDILNNARSYPLELTLANGKKLRIKHRKEVHFPPRLKIITYFPPRVSDGFADSIPPDEVLKVRTRLRPKKRAA